MHEEHIATPEKSRAFAREALISELQNTHALERQAISVLESQLKTVSAFPEFHARLAQHIGESHEQSMRLERALEACNAAGSSLKDALVSFLGKGQSSFRSIGDDAVLKVLQSNTMFESMEIAAYRGLLELTDKAGMAELRPELEKSLQEEEAMASWLHDNLQSIVARYVELATAERVANEADQPGSSQPERSASGADADTDDEAGRMDPSPQQDKLHGPKRDPE